VIVCVVSWAHVALGRGMMGRHGRGWLAVGACGSWVAGLYRPWWGSLSTKASESAGRYSRIVEARRRRVRKWHCEIDTSSQCGRSVEVGDEVKKYIS
jgi:hypothetical protein